MTFPPCLSYLGLLKLVMCLMSYKHTQGMCLIFFLSTAAGCGRVSPERSSYSQENCCQRGGGNITISLSVLSLFSFQNTWSFIISTCGPLVDALCTQLFLCVWFQMISPLSLEQALSARDSMAKAIYVFLEVKIDLCISNITSEGI